MIWPLLQVVGPKEGCMLCIDLCYTVPLVIIFGKWPKKWDHTYKRLKWVSSEGWLGRWEVPHSEFWVELLLLLIERSQLRGARMRPGHLLWGSNWVETPGKSPGRLEGLHVSPGLGMPQYSSRRAGGAGWEDGDLGLLVYGAAPATWIQISGSWWMDVTVWAKGSHTACTKSCWNLH